MVDSVYYKYLNRTFKCHVFCVDTELGGMSQFKAMKRKYVKNSESGQNPERYRHCMHGGTAWDESQSLGTILRRQCRDAVDM